MHGITRAAITKAQGGRWSSGFWSGFASSGFSVGTKDYGGFVGRTAIMGIVGGTVSEISGGKFANGAVSGAFVHLFNNYGREDYIVKNNLLEIQHGEKDRKVQWICLIIVVLQLKQLLQGKLPKVIYLVQE